ncbi:MAG: hypothetical protein E5V72_01505 [Mesorhizobium sp.]|uniref:hypothetical protein n=1 Tax=Mesorhizobium sp. TaxID=1871066 RepID=UPI000FE59684|nr:hypothetical protein [Mesorhizobium sp.]RWH50258.1 MAG: hypothetical protein EOQ80_04615 [Mesorhizobium sp.]RWH52276.1 MAG: hypothetical protein EOQ82_26630 [Mesorhizobium sp.]RWI69691.1 MAG: hypothetical protein EOR18_20905 [Mesorhizobium sp.]RWI76158.1 MAG: hypothetical protein EOR19_18495 [Mesorhizobium sp.]RWJ33228.1 MAG: hypothetical protein EOR28_11625 [Mesorhizobium sp.]
MNRRFDDSDLQTLANICEAAANRFHENAVTLRQMKMTDLASQFEQQEKEARDLSSLFMNAEPFEVTYESA